VLVCPTRIGPVADDAMVAGALERNQRLLEQLGKEEAGGIAGICRSFDRCGANMLDAEKDLSRHEFRPSNSGAGRPEGVKIACLAPLVALR
jgi:hypothetical protein